MTVPIGVCAVVRGSLNTLNTGKVLLWHGDVTLKQPDLWGFPGGKLEEGETLEQCCLRELKEETNLVGTSPRYITSIAHSWLKPVPESSVKQWVTVYFQVTVLDAAGLRNMEPHKHGAFEFATPDEADFHPRVFFMGTAAVLKEMKILDGTFHG